MNSPSSSSTASPPLSTKSLLESVAAARAAGSERGLDAFLARAELAKVTRALRARLSYASYKAANNVTHVPLHTLEQQQDANAPRSPPAEGNPSGVVTNSRSLAQSPRRRPPQSQMMPPPAAPSLYSSIITKGSPRSSGTSSSAHKRARHSSPAQPPASPKPKASSSTAARASAASPRGSRKKKKARATSPSSRSVASTRSSRGGDVDMQDGGSTTELEDLSAAAALTSLLHNATTSTANNSSGSGASVPHSPTPSHASSFTEVTAGSASGSGHHRRDGTNLSASGMASISELLSPRGSISMPSSQGDRNTPKPSSDADAAEMMLYLATSPSPARPTVRRPERVLSRNTGRVLFPSGNSMSSTDDGDVGTQFGSGSYARSDAGPSRPMTHSLSAFDRPPPEIRDTVIYTHTRTRTAPESIYVGDLLPAPNSPSGTVYGGSQELADSQQTAVGAWDDDIGTGKGKERSIDDMPVEDATPASMRISSPMSVDKPDESDAQKSAHYGNGEFGGYLDPALNPRSPSQQPSSAPYAENLRSPPPFMMYGTSDVRGARQDHPILSDTTTSHS